LTQTSIFDTIIKHLSRRWKRRKEKVDPKELVSKEFERNRKKFKKRIDKKPQKRYTLKVR